MNKAKAVNEKSVLANFEKLSKEGEKEVVDFISYLKIKEELEATKEILNDKDFLKSIIRGDEDFKAGRFKKWSEVKEDEILRSAQNDKHKLKAILQCSI